MCDTIVALANSTENGAVIFAKNSDREANEAHHVEFIEAKNHPAGEMLQCTRIEIPQASKTFSTLLSKPFNIWGAEMGSNEYGLTIGNEAIFTKGSAPKKNALTGMDLLRLALERAKNAYQAVEIITSLLEEYGQGGNGGYQSKLYYHNSFLIADPRGAWVLETVGKNWAAKEVKSVYTISNSLSIGREWDIASPNLVKHAIEKGWCKKESEFHFAKNYSDFLYTKFSYAKERQSCTINALTESKGKITVTSMVALLQNHAGNHGKKWHPMQKDVGHSVCMHAGFGPFRDGQTTGSMIAHLDTEQQTHFLTGTAAPCTSLFKPIWVDTPWKNNPKPSAHFDNKSLFWKHERLHRATLLDYANRIKTYNDEQKEFQQKIIADALSKTQRSQKERAKLSQAYFDQAMRLEEKWAERVSKEKVQKNSGYLYKIGWNNYNKKVKIPVS